MRLCLADILWKAGVACYVILVATARGGPPLGSVYQYSLTGKPLPMIIYLADLLSVHRCLGYISPPAVIGVGGGLQPVGLNAGIVYNSDPTSRIFNF